MYPCINRYLFCRSTATTVKHHRHSFKSSIIVWIFKTKFASHVDHGININLLWLAKKHSSISHCLLCFARFFECLPLIFHFSFPAGRFFSSISLTLRFLKTTRTHATRMRGINKTYTTENTTFTFITVKYFSCETLGCPVENFLQHRGSWIMTLNSIKHYFSRLIMIDTFCIIGRNQQKYIEDNISHL